MDKLIGRLAAKAGIGSYVAEKPLVIVLPPHKDLSETRGIQNVGRELFGFGHVRNGAGQMGEIVSGTRGFSQLA